jgi:hypothetical protein
MCPNFSKFQFKMPLEKTALVDLIRREIFAGVPLPEIVSKVTKKAGIDLGEHSNNTSKGICNEIPLQFLEMFENWLDFAKESRLRRRNTLQKPELLNDDVRSILQSVHEQYEKAKRRFNARACIYRGCKMKMLSERYAIDGRHDKNWTLEALIIHDCLNGQSM